MVIGNSKKNLIETTHIFIEWAVKRQQKYIASQ